MRTPKKRVHSHKKTASSTGVLKPLKKAGKRTINFVTHKPGKSLGLAALATGLCVSLIYAKRKLR